MDISGISEATTRKFIEKGFPKTFYDFYHLDCYRNEIVQMEGFGGKSYKKIISSVEKSRNIIFIRYVVLGVTVDGYKDILSITVGANETSRFWLGMLNDLKNRGVEDVLFFCVDGLPGFKEAIQSVHRQKSRGALSICCATLSNM